MATVAPRPLLICQAVKDRLFPIKGVREVYYRAREVYKAFGAEDNIELHEDYGPHSYAEAIRVGSDTVLRQAPQGRRAEAVRVLHGLHHRRGRGERSASCVPGRQAARGHRDARHALRRDVGGICRDVKRPQQRAAYRAYRDKGAGASRGDDGPAGRSCRGSTSRSTRGDRVMGADTAVLIHERARHRHPVGPHRAARRGASRVVLYVDAAGKAKRRRAARGARCSWRAARQSCRWTFAARARRRASCRAKRAIHAQPVHHARAAHIDDARV